MLTACERSSDPAPQAEIRGTAINVSSNSPVVGFAAVGTNPIVASRTAQVEDGYLKLPFDVLSGFKYDTYEVLDEVHGGRPLTKSDDVIPSHIKAYDGRKVLIEGYIMPLRLKKGLVTEFLLFRDQAACCFGDKAKMNHYMRVKVTDKGFEPGSAMTYKVRGTLAVGDIYVQDYLTGIYQMSADRVEEMRSRGGASSASPHLEKRLSTGEQGARASPPAATSTCTGKRRIAAGEDARAPPPPSASLFL